MAGNYFDSFRRGGMFYGLSRSLDPATPEGAEARNYLRDAVMERVNAARGMFGAGVELATNRNTLAEALARQPKPFTEESAKNAQTMAEGFWNPAGLLGGAMGVTKFEKAHKVAQKNAAKPISEGGLGLPKDNTAADRAKALGFDTDAYHATIADVDRFKKNKVTAYGDRFFFSPKADYAESFAALDSEIAGNSLDVKKWKELNSRSTGQNTMPVILKSGEFKDWSHISPEYVVRDPSMIRSRFAAFDPARKHEADLLAGYFGFQLPQFEERK